MTTTTPERAARRDTAFLGHPVGLGWLASAELCERFSFYGMSALLPVYLLHFLLKSHNADPVIGFSALQSVIGFFYGAAPNPEALQAHISSAYSSLVYLTPLAGGLLADRFIGRTRSVTIGALLMAFGHFLMAFQASFVLALLFLIAGVGFFKANIASQVGDLYSQDDPRRATAFQIFLLSVQIAVIGAPIICGWLGERVSWDLGFGLAGIVMLIGLAVYLGGRKSLPAEPPRTAASRAARPPLQRTDWIKIAALVTLIPILAVSIIGNQQINIAYPGWSEDTIQLIFFGWPMPTTWLQSVDAIVSTVTMIGVIAFWKWWERRRAEPDEITKIAIGVAISALAPLALAAASAAALASHHKAGFEWVMLFEVLNDIGFANVLPVGLALFSRAAPKGFAGLTIGVYYLHLVLGNYVTGLIGGTVKTLPGTTFWLLHVGLMLGGAATLLVFRALVGRFLAPAYGAPPPEHEAAA